MELPLLALTFVMSIALALAGAYVAVSLVLFCMKRAVIRSEGGWELALARTDQHASVLDEFKQVSGEYGGKF